jgi:hypothetical protein
MGVMLLNLNDKFVETIFNYGRMALMPYAIDTSKYVKQPLGQSVVSVPNQGFNSQSVSIGSQFTPQLTTLKTDISLVPGSLFQFPFGITQPFNTTNHIRSQNKLVFQSPLQYIGLPPGAM